MQIKANRVRGFAARPDPRAAGFLIYGPEPTEVDALRRRLTDALAERGEFDVTRLDAQEARRDPAALADTLQSTALFGGKPLLLLENATDGLAAPLTAAVEGLTPDAAALVVTAGALPAKSRLRKLFEGGEALAALGVYPQAVDRAGLSALLQETGARLSDEALDRLETFAQAADAAHLRALAHTLGLMSLDAEAPLSAEDVAALLPDSVEGETDAVVSATLARRPAEALAAFGRVAGQGSGVGTAVMALGRQFRQLHALSSAPDGPEAALGRLRPPVYGPRRDALLRAARSWPTQPCERALGMISDTELTLRATGGAPDKAVAERLIVRLCMLGGR